MILMDFFSTEPSVFPALFQWLIRSGVISTRRSKRPFVACSNFRQKKAECVQDIQSTQVELDRLRAQRRKTARKVLLDSLPEDQRPTQLLPLNKQLADTVKMIAYRAETAMVGMLRRNLKKEDEARALVRELFVSSADIEPDDCAATLTIRIHRMASPAHDKAIVALLEELTE